MTAATTPAHAAAGRGFRCLLPGAMLLAAVAFLTAAPAPVTFNRDIRPILADNCFHCHGFEPKQRKADLRLDTAEGAIAIRDGAQAVLPGNPAASELIRRITSSDPEKIMPPPQSGKKLTQLQISTLERWIKEGAAYQKHWAFEPPAKAVIPSVNATNWGKNEIDAFILSTIESRGIAPSPEAPKETLIRRVTLDLTGLLPTVEEVEAFLGDSQPGAYERVVDRLLASPRYGEHMAHYWLDLARYGDTHGLHLDNERGIWPYRDWVIKAFNDNLRFDDFTVWQLAGDLLPNPTREQLVASGFNRCNVSTSEGGAIDDEFYVRYAVDRVETASTAWLGLTMGCAACHDHKLDPITQKEFYQVFSIFNNMDEKAMDGNALLPPPVLKLPNPEQEKELQALTVRTSEIRAQIKTELSRTNYVDPHTITNLALPPPSEIVWLEDDYPEGAEVQNDGEAAKWVSAPEPVHSGAKSLSKAGKGVHQTFFTKSSKALVAGAGSKLFAHVYLDPKDPPKAIMLQYHVTTWNNRANWGDADLIPYGNKDTFEKVQMGALPEIGRWVRLEFEPTKLGLMPGTTITGIAFTAYDGRMLWDKVGIIAVNDPALDPARSLVAWAKAEKALAAKSSAPKEIKALLKKDFAALPEAERKKVEAHYLENVWNEPGTTIAAARANLTAVSKQQETLDKAVPQTMISKELEKPRPAHVLIRGEYEKHGEPVGPGVPSFLPPLPEGSATNRLAFAKWLVDGKHPLTARVTVNRFWQQFFGTGLVKTAEDFGSKGEWPSHPELVDWLACAFPERDWDMKWLVREMVTSATYRQDSKVTPALSKVDPDNRLLARATRFRLDPEVLRDTALQVSGLLNLEGGGRGVRTYQPPGIWEAVGYTKSDTAKYTQDKGPAIYRRSIYMFIKRTAPSPLMTTFDAPSREHCQARRERTNTPLQALLTMNDIQYFEAARHFAHRMLKGSGATDADRLKTGFRAVTSREPAATELDTLLDVLAAQQTRYAAEAEAAGKTLAVGDSPVQTDVPSVDLAAYTLVANLMLNLDETLNRN